MANRKVVVALGGNAILSTDASAKAQQEALMETAKYLVKFIEQGDELIISHGNGPQVGNLLIQQQAADSEKTPAMPLDTCVAMTEGSIGYWLQNAMGEVLKQKGIDKDVVSLVTQVIVDENDPSFKNPTKPIGPFYSEEEATAQMKADSNVTFKEDAGRGWRKVVASPKPISIKEARVIEALVDQGVVTVSVGGGGIPVVETATGLEGREAVIDKDFASEKLAEIIDADLLIVLTGVDNVYVNYQKPDQKKLETVTISEMKQYISEDQFAPGSMLPKVEAAIQFVEARPNAKAIITSLENIENLLASEEGTIVVAD
ncbi:MULTISPECIES: carbamate kinase [Enterococcus]|uniref:Carbamate kinase n=1 Tax=Enterococcus thailandicus TaxID=417368 RepID=A0A179EQ91_ENTTH|nr:MULTISPECIES: carbamate kinase [Enterococcus]MDA3964945.1 carbamate kinase [Enterococcus thailandicus]MDA3974362.1 carbamate kinase [Enterococcus thailandicus]MDA3976849.1 carbamate kinase [Enterococcus thailandicus]MDA3981815.1 carbamate kinase [Enterococcus thailandicus]MDK4351362.1 carbamate kinase [Enterococcus thailandicus]